jgi:hypothetical protein
MIMPKITIMQKMLGIITTMLEMLVINTASIGMSK